MLFPFFFFNDTATTEIYTLSLHDALPILRGSAPRGARALTRAGPAGYTHTKYSVRAGGRSLYTGIEGREPGGWPRGRDRKSTRLNSSHLVISYAVFCLKKKKKNTHTHDVT